MRTKCSRLPDTSPERTWPEFTTTHRNWEVPASGMPQLLDELLEETKDSHGAAAAWKAIGGFLSQNGRDGDPGDCRVTRLGGEDRRVVAVRASVRHGCERLGATARPGAPL